MKINKIITSTILALAFFTLINASGWELKYEIDNQTDEDLIVEFKFTKGKPYNFFDTLASYFKKTVPEGSIQEHLIITLPKKSKKSGKEYASGSSGNYYIIFQNQKTSAMFGPNTLNVPGVYPQDKREQLSPNTRYDLLNKYDPSSEEAIFKLRIRHFDFSHFNKHELELELLKPSDFSEKKEL